MEGVSKQTIEHEIGGVRADAMRFGLHGVKADILEVHPFQSAHQSAKKRTEETNRAMLRNTYGSAFPLKMELDQQILSRFQRPPGALPSSMLGYEALTGSLDDFGFEDYHCVNNPFESETFRPVDMHHGMEVRLGLSKGPVHPSVI
ncbi:hypothetical protein ACHQM5_005834 [Ranunculus cassubicifolius]